MEYSGDKVFLRMEDCLMLMGKYNNSIDPKNRMIIPSKYRDELGFKCVLTKGNDKCLYIYPMCEWEKVKEKLSSLPTSDKNIRAYVRRFYANAVECEIDKQGRVTIPIELKEFAGIEKELVTVGMIDKIEVWSRSEWEALDEIADNSPDLESKLAEYGI